MTPGTVARQAPLSMGFSRQEDWSGLPFPSPGNFPDSGIEPWQAESLPLSCLGSLSVQFSCSVVSDSLRPHESQHARSPCPSPTPRDHSTVHRVGDAIQPSHPLSFPSPPAFNLCQAWTKHFRCVIVFIYYSLPSM